MCEAFPSSAGTWGEFCEVLEKFHWPRLLQEEVITLTVEQLNWLLDGYDVDQIYACELSVLY